MPKPMTRPEAGLTIGHTLHLPKRYWDELDSYRKSRDWTRSELIRRLLERAKVVALDPADAELIGPDPNGDPVEALARTVEGAAQILNPQEWAATYHADKTPGTPEWRKRKLSSTEGRKEIAAYDAEHEKF